MKPHITKRQGHWQALRPRNQLHWSGNIDADKQVRAQLLHEQHAFAFVCRLNKRNLK